MPVASAGEDSATTADTGSNASDAEVAEHGDTLNLLPTKPHRCSEPPAIAAESGSATNRDAW